MRGCFFRYAGWFCSAWLLLGGGSVFAQADVTNPVIVPLVTERYDAGNSAYYKYGIWAGIGGGSQQLYEFDTGGVGFYAVYGTNTPWWGSYTPTTNNVTITFDSGNFYTATAVSSSVQLYTNATASTPAVTIGHDIMIGQTTNIVNSPNTLWPVSGDPPPPPVDSHFYGDFGLNFQQGADVGGTNNIANVFAQLSYGGTAKGGFIVHTGPYGSTNGAYVQVGVTQAQIDSFAMKFHMRGKDTNHPFPGTTTATYAAELLAAVLNLDNTYSTNVDLNLDTGNPTPGLHNVTNGVPAQYLTTNGDALIDDLVLQLSAQEDGSTNTPTIWSFVTGDKDGVDHVYAQEKDKFYLNVGAPFFQNYDVMFDFEDGIIGLNPATVPETRQMSLMFVGIAGLWVFAAARGIVSRRRKKIKEA